MSTFPEPQQEHPSTYVVQDRTNQEEVARLLKQDQLITSSMGGVLAEQPDPARLRRVLDIGCGTGGWLLETARTYPDIELLIGVDINSRMIHLAREQAEAQQLSNRVEFRVMDALRMLEFPDDYFDLVNVRLAISYLRTWDWPKFLEECRRVSQAGGVVRITETDVTALSNSAALDRLMGLQREALYHAGHLFTSEGDSLIRELPRMMERFGFQQVQTRTSMTVGRAGTEEWRLGYEDIRLLFRTSLPFLQKWTRVPDDYQEIYQQMLNDLQQPDYEGTAHYYTIWGTTPAR